MVKHSNFLQLIRLIGFLVWVIVVGANWWLIAVTPQRFQGASVGLWCATMLAFVVVYVVASEPHWPRLSQPVRLSLCALEAALALYANHMISGNDFHAALLVVVAGHVSYLLPLPATVVWATAQAALYLLSLLYEHWSPRDAVAYGAWTLFYQLFVVLTLGIAMRETRARTALSRANTELRAARALLEQQSRLAERLRISRDMHDILGHHLTALNMNLEVAAYDPGADRVPGHLERARELSRLLLQDVREAVSAMREADAAEVRRSLETMAADLPHLKVHLSVPPDLSVPDVTLAQVMLRCAGEIITNTARHANAQNLWVEVLRTPAGLEVRARDDGRGTSEIQLGSGLRGMRERLEEVGGRLTLASEPQRGFHVRAFVPLVAEVA